jgi:hypothetical protein
MVKSRLVNNIGGGTIVAARGFFVPFAVGIFVLDGLCAAGDTLLQSGSMCGSPCCAMIGKGFGKHTINRIGPTAVVLNDLVYDMGHKLLADCYRS